MEVVDRAGKAEDGIFVYSCASHNLIFWKNNKNNNKNKQNEKGKLPKNDMIMECE